MLEAVALAVALSVAVAPAVAKKVQAFRAEPSLTAALTRPRPLPDGPPGGQDARDIRFVDGLIDHPGYAVTPQGILATFRLAEQGQPQRQCDMFDDLVENDAHLRNLFEQREQAVAGKPWVIQADGQVGDSELAARVLSEAMRRLPMIEVFQHLLTFNRYGYACAEIDWDVQVIDGATYIVPTWIAAVPARRFRIVTAANAPGAGIDELRLFADITRPYGDELRATKWIVLRRSSTWLSRAGLMRTASWQAMAKRLSFRDALIFSQKFGLPLPIAHYDESADDEAKNVGEQIGRAHV